MCYNKRTISRWILDQTRHRATPQQRLSFITASTVIKMINAEESERSNHTLSSKMFLIQKTPIQAVLV